MVTILVGPQKTSFVAHKILCAKSEYFEKAFNGEFRERNGVIELPEDIPKAIGCFLDWVYTGKIDYSTVQSAEDCESFSQETLYPAYFLAQKLVLNSFQNEVMNTIQRSHYREEYLMPAEDIKMIYENTLPGSKIRLYCQVVVVHCIADQNFRPDGAPMQIAELRNYAGLYSTVPDFALDVMRFQGNHGDVFYFDPRQDFRSRRDPGFGSDGFTNGPDGLGSKFFHV
jgi:hypothetical protein